MPDPGDIHAARRDSPRKPSLGRRVVIGPAPIQDHMTQDFPKNMLIPDVYVMIRFFKNKGDFESRPESGKARAQGY